MNKNSFNDSEIFAILPEDFRFDDCYYCICHLCVYLRTTCRNCYLCEFSAYPRRSCQYFLPFVFRRSDLLEWFRAVELARGYNQKFDYFDFKG